MTEGYMLGKLRTLRVFKYDGGRLYETASGRPLERGINSVQNIPRIQLPFNNFAPQFRCPFVFSTLKLPDPLPSIQRPIESG